MYIVAGLRLLVESNSKHGNKYNFDFVPIFYGSGMSTVIRTTGSETGNSVFAHMEGTRLHRCNLIDFK